jgi:hypothetical protein
MLILAQMFEKENSSLWDETQCLGIDKKWYLNIQPNEQKPKLLKTNNYKSGCYLV